MSTRDVLHALLAVPTMPPEASAYPSGIRRRYELDVEVVGARSGPSEPPGPPSEPSLLEDDDPDRPAWTDDDDAVGGASGADD